MAVKRHRLNRDRAKATYFRAKGSSFLFLSVQLRLRKEFDHSTRPDLRPDKEKTVALRLLQLCGESEQFYAPRHNFQIGGEEHKVMKNDESSGEGRGMNVEKGCFRVTIVYCLLSWE